MRADNIGVEEVFAKDHESLADAVNDKLTELGATEIIDIKYGKETAEQYSSALIIYQRNKI